MLGPSETDLDFLGRRAMEEAQAAATASTASAAAAHRRMAAVYAARLREQQDVAAQFEALLADIGGPADGEEIGA